MVKLIFNKRETGEEQSSTTIAGITAYPCAIE